MLLYLYLLFFLMIRPPPRSTRPDTLFPCTTLFRCRPGRVADVHVVVDRRPAEVHGRAGRIERGERLDPTGQVVVQAQAHRGLSRGLPAILPAGDRKSTRLNSSH